LNLRDNLLGGSSATCGRSPPPKLGSNPPTPVNPNAKQCAEPGPDPTPENRIFPLPAGAGIVIEVHLQGIIANAAQQAANGRDRQQRQEDESAAGVGVAQRVPGGVQVGLQGDRHAGDARERVAGGEDARLGQVVARPQMEQPAVPPLAKTRVSNPEGFRESLVQ
jgi:hypothetical protein